MKNQHFYIFYSEKNEIYLKLVRAYTNRFCIDENDQSEVIGFQPLTEMSETNFVLSVFQYLNPMQSYKFEGLQVRRIARDMFSNKLIEVLWKNKLHRFQPHFILGIPRKQFTKNIAKFVSGRNRKFDLTVTLLDGQIKILNRHFDRNQFKNKLTIDDDIDLLNNQSSIFSDKFSVRSKCLSVFLGVDDSYGIIKCNRKSYGGRNGFENFLKDFLIHLYLIIVLLLINNFISKWFGQGTSEIVIFDSRPWFSFLQGFLLGFLLILQIFVLTASFYMLWKLYITFYHVFVVLFIPSIKFTRRIRLIYVKFNLITLCRIFLALVFLSLAYVFISSLYEDTSSLIANIKRLISLVQ